MTSTKFTQVEAQHLNLCNSQSLNMINCIQCFKEYTNERVKKIIIIIIDLREIFRGESSHNQKCSDKSSCAISPCGTKKGLFCY